MITQLNNRALLKLSGSDTQPFLQGQLTNDIDALEEGMVQLNAYCQHQGKIIALIWVMKKDADYYLSLPNDLSDIVIKRLTMFKMMSEVEITDITDQTIQLGVLNEDFEGVFKLNEKQAVALVDSTDGIGLGDTDAWELACITQTLSWKCWVVN